jgi:ATP-binding cassette subfamily C protein
MKPAVPVADPMRALRRLAHRALGFGLFVGFCVSLLQLVVPLYMMQVYDRVLGSGNLDTLAALTLLVAGALVVHALLDLTEAEAFAAVGHKVARAATVPSIEAAVAAAASGATVRPSQALRDVAELRAFAGSPHVSAPLEVALSPILLLVLFLLHPAYGLVAVAGALLLGGLAIVGRISTGAAQREANRRLVEGTSALEGAARAAEAIGPLGMMGNLAARWDAWSFEHLALVEAAGSVARRLTAIAKSLRFALQAAVIGVGALLVLREAASPGSMFAASLVMARAVGPFERMVDSWRVWTSALECWRRIETLLTGARRRTGAGTLPPPAGILTVERLTYLPPGRSEPTLRNVGFRVQPGEAVAVVGPSGAGKSTLARLVVGGAEPTQGAVYLDGYNLWTWGGDAMGRHVGYVPQTVALLDGTVADTIARMGPVDWDAVLLAARRAGAHEMIGRLPGDYEARVGDGGTLLSGGQRQLLALARALYGEPRLLVLDEPNAALDHAGDVAVVTAIEQAKGWGAAVLVITHRPSLLACVDRVVVLRDGMVEQIGARAEVMARLAGPPRPAPVRAADGGGDAPGPAPGPRLASVP